MARAEPLLHVLVRGGGGWPSVEACDVQPQHLAVALGGDCLADVGTLRAEPGVFGPVACDPTVVEATDTAEAAVGRTLLGYGPARSGAPVAGAELAERVEAAWQSWQSAGDRFSTAAQTLPTLVAELPLGAFQPPEIPVREVVPGRFDPLLGRSQVLPDGTPVGARHYQQ
ncbi:hypothetical protein ACIHJG_37860 [Streptomyces sp. NPDC052415]|uniref:hypothetical protein n=1 Tax=Streptomyces sp. NPDC052415 TaxID=3365690 RepID=UPI0037CECBF2